MKWKCPHCGGAPGAYEGPWDRCPNCAALSRQHVEAVCMGIASLAYRPASGIYWSPGRFGPGEHAYVARAEIPPFHRAVPGGQVIAATSELAARAVLRKTWENGREYQALLDEALAVLENVGIPREDLRPVPFSMDYVVRVYDEGAKDADGKRPVVALLIYRHTLGWHRRWGEKGLRLSLRRRDLGEAGRSALAELTSPEVRQWRERKGTATFPAWSSTYLTTASYALAR